MRCSTATDWGAVGGVWQTQRDGKNGGQEAVGQGVAGGQRGGGGRNSLGSGSQCSCSCCSMLGHNPLVSCTATGTRAQSALNASGVSRSCLSRAQTGNSPSGWAAMALRGPQVPLAGLGASQRVLAGAQQVPRGAKSQVRRALQGLVPRLECTGSLNAGAVRIGCRAQLDDQCRPGPSPPRNARGTMVVASKRRCVCQPILSQGTR